MKLNIVLAGVGGQGILSIATILGSAALADGLYLKQAEVHGMSQRGGDVQSNLRISSTPIASDLIGLGGADLIISLEPMEALRYLPYLSADGTLVTSTVAFENISPYPTRESLEAEFAKLPKVVALDMDAIAKSAATLRSANMALLGAASPAIPIAAEKIEAAIERVFAPKGEKIVEQNIAAFRAGREAAAKHHAKN